MFGALLLTLVPNHRENASSLASVNFTVASLLHIDLFPGVHAAMAAIVDEIYCYNGSVCRRQEVANKTSTIPTLVPGNGLSTKNCRRAPNSANMFQDLSTTSSMNGRQERLYIEVSYHKQSVY